MNFPMYYTVTFKLKNKYYDYLDMTFLCYNKKMVKKEIESHKKWLKKERFFVTGIECRRTTDKELSNALADEVIIARKAVAVMRNGKHLRKRYPVSYKYARWIGYAKRIGYWDRR